MATTPEFKYAPMSPVRKEVLCGVVFCIRNMCLLSCRFPGFGYTLFKIKRRGILYSCLSQSSGSRIASTSG